MTVRSLAAAVFAACLAMSCANTGTAQARARIQPAAALLTTPEFEPSRLFAPAPQPGSTIEVLEMQRLKALRAAASPERIAQAERDAEDESADVFNEAAGRDLTRLPATLDLLTQIEGETERLVYAGKRYFKRLRPYGVDPQLPHCGHSTSVDGGYPSGHAGFGWSTAWTLARLMPDRAPQLLARAQDYGLSREICGAHFQSDIEASHAAALLIADRLLLDPRLAGRVAAARRELAQP